MTQNEAWISRPSDSSRRSMLPVEAYSLWAETYDSHPNPLLSLEERKLIPVLPNLEGAFVLDVACGTGRWLKTLLHRGAKQGVGIDLSREMLAQARRKQELQGHLVLAECTAIPLSSAIADLAVCSFAAGYVADLGGLASELSRVLRKGGCLILSDFHPSASHRGWRRTFRHAEDVVEILNFQYPVEHLCTVFQERGFNPDRVISPCFGEAERVIFEGYGKERLFERARTGPAIVICCFRLGSSCIFR